MKKIILSLVACLMASLTSVSLFSSCSSDNDDSGIKAYDIRYSIVNQGTLPDGVFSTVNSLLAQMEKKSQTIPAGKEQEAAETFADQFINKFSLLIGDIPQLGESTFTVRVSLSTPGTKDDKYKIDINCKDGKASR